MRVRKHASLANLALGSHYRAELRLRRHHPHIVLEEIRKAVRVEPAYSESYSRNLLQDNHKALREGRVASVDVQILLSVSSGRLGEHVAAFVPRPRQHLGDDLVKLSLHPAINLPSVVIPRNSAGGCDASVHLVCFTPRKVEMTLFLKGSISLRSAASGALPRSMLLVSARSWVMFPWFFKTG